MRITIKIASAAIFGAIAGLLTPIYIWATHWGFNLDLIAIPWIICFLSFGTDAAILSFGISFPIITLLDDAGWIGATTKIVATVWLVIIPAIIIKLKKVPLESLHKNMKLLVIAFLLGIIIRDFVMILFNFYIAIPIFFNTTIEIATEWVVSQSEWFFQPIAGIDVILAFCIIIIFWNTIQSIVDIIPSYIIAKRLIIPRIQPYISEQ